MKFSALALVFAPALLCGAQDVPSPPAEESTELVNETPPGAFLGGGDLDYHIVPALWNFEVDKDVIEDSSILALVEQAFITSANEAHDKNSIVFHAVRIKQVIHEEVGDDSDEALQFYSSLGKIISPAVEGDGDTLETFLRGGLQGDEKKFRMRYRASSSVTCRLCPNDRRLASMSSIGADATPSLTNAFYASKEGRLLLADWQKGFCKKLDKMKVMQHPKRCFVQMDFDHEDPDEGNLDDMDIEN